MGEHEKRRDRDLDGSPRGDVNHLEGYVLSDRRRVCRGTGHLGIPDRIR